MSLSGQSSESYMEKVILFTMNSYYYYEQLMCQSTFILEGRKKKRIVVFRLTDIPSHLLLRWQLKKNERFFQRGVEQR